MSTSRKLAMTLSLSALVCAATISPAAARPDTPVNPSASQPASMTRDIRSPDARDAANNYSPAVEQSAAVSRELRSPDTRDVAAGYDPKFVAEPVSATSSGDGFDWVSAAIGASVVGGLLILLLAGRATHFGRRHALHT